jgi:hypothetical protein
MKCLLRSHVPSWLLIAKKVSKQTRKFQIYQVKKGILDIYRATLRRLNKSCAEDANACWNPAAAGLRYMVNSKGRVPD